MDTITARAEQAVLGALLTRRTGQQPPVRAGDFADARHQAIYAAISGNGPQPSGLLGRLRAWITTLPWRRQVRDMRAYMTQLPAFCPDPDNLEGYASIVAEASRQRTAQAATGPDASEPDGSATQDLNRLAGAAAWLASQGQRQPAARQPAASATQAIANTLYRKQASNVQPVQAARANGVAPQRQAVSAETQQRQRAAAVPAGPEAGKQQPVSNEQPLRRKDLEQLVLADLLRHPRQAAKTLEWLPIEAFTDQGNRTVYQAIKDLVDDGQQPDPLFVAWAARDWRNAGVPERQGPDPDEVLRLAETPAAPGTAALIGRALLADQLCTRWRGEDWPQYWSRLADRVPATSSATETVPEPEPSARPEQPAAEAGQSAASNGGRKPKHAPAETAGADTTRSSAEPMQPAPVPAPSGPAPRM